MKDVKGYLAQGTLVLVGGWLMAAPAVLGHAGSDIGSSDRVVGPSILAAAFLGFFAITRLVRWFNALPGTWLLVAPFVLDAPTDAAVNDVLCGVLVLGLFWIDRGPQDRYGGGWATLVRPDRLPRG